ncbi:UPF0149 family protein [Granulosicoccaceae sp. 1_MG-2023]|nr:UPF0149 family protein [Granulosicoccaceae sp. 1_MG-2023]
MKLPVTYEKFDAVLGRLGAPLGAAESHGLLCGLICTLGAQSARDPWLVNCLDEAPSPDNPVLTEFRQDALALFEATVKSVNDASLGFLLFLPDEEDTTLDVRTAALGQWCQGYVYGLGLGGYKESKTARGDIPELVRDISMIAGAGYEGENPEGDEEEQAAYIEVEEYVRVGVMLVLEELQPIERTSPIGNAPH